jgi:RHH-type proline utilization regulon transcriptional repressor/proline dehydrogenase/delta 1-pyrroline-5-carboxylate dehydrogenase
LTQDAAAETFVPPTLIELDSIRTLKREVFGPVLHVVRFRRDRLDALLEDIRATGYGLTFSVHSRIDETIERVVDGVRAGNIYVNRNMIGAVVGVQPFGGEGLSGTGPKAGGPLYVRRLLAACPPRRGSGGPPPASMASLIELRDWLTAAGDMPAARLCAHYLDTSPLRDVEILPGPTGELNTYELRPRGRVLCNAETRLGALAQLGAALATGNLACFTNNAVTSTLLAQLPPGIRNRTCLVENSIERSCESEPDDFAAALFEGEPSMAAASARQLAARDGPIVTPQCLTADDISGGKAYYSLEWLVTERSISINTAAAGGNASLMTIG